MKQVINHGKDGGLLNMITSPPRDSEKRSA